MACWKVRFYEHRQAFPKSQPCQAKWFLPTLLYYLWISPDFGVCARVGSAFMCDWRKEHLHVSLSTGFPHRPYFMMAGTKAAVVTEWPNSKQAHSSAMEVHGQSVSPYVRESVRFLSGCPSLTGRGRGESDSELRAGHTEHRWPRLSGSRGPAFLSLPHRWD